MGDPVVPVIVVAVLALLALAGFFVVSLLNLRMASEYMRTASRANADLCRALIAARTPDPGEMLGKFQNTTAPDLGQLFLGDDEPESPSRYYSVNDQGDVD